MRVRRRRRAQRRAGQPRPMQRIPIRAPRGASTVRRVICAPCGSGGRGSARAAGASSLRRRDGLGEHRALRHRGRERRRRSPARSATARARRPGRLGRRARRRAGRRCRRRRRGGSGRRGDGGAGGRERPGRAALLRTVRDPQAPSPVRLAQGVGDGRGAGDGDAVVEARARATPHGPATAAAPVARPACPSTRPWRGASYPRGLAAMIGRLVIPGAAGLRDAARASTTPAIAARSPSAPSAIAVVMIRPRCASRPT